MVDTILEAGFQILLKDAAESNAAAREILDDPDAASQRSKICQTKARLTAHLSSFEKFRPPEGEADVYNFALKVLPILITTNYNLAEINLLWDEMSAKIPISDSAQPSSDNIHDFDFTEQSLPKSRKLMDDNTDVRKSFYSVWANSEDVVSLYHRVVTLLTDFFKSYYISEENDILVSFIKRETPKTEDVTSISCRLDHEVEIQDYCLPQPILISKTIMRPNNRFYATTKTKKIGFHHIYIYIYSQHH